MPRQTQTSITLEMLREQYAYWLRSAGELQAPAINAKIQQASAWGKEQFLALPDFVDFLRYTSILR